MFFKRNYVVLSKKLVFQIKNYFLKQKHIFHIKHYFFKTKNCFSSNKKIVFWNNNNNNNQKNNIEKFQIECVYKFTTPFIFRISNAALSFFTYGVAFNTIQTPYTNSTSKPPPLKKNATTHPPWECPQSHI